MTCLELSQEYGAYSLGIAENPERSEIDEHLARGCPNCVPGVRKARTTVASLAGAVGIVEPPARLRRRVIALVTPPEEQRKFAILPWAVAGFLAVALIAVAVSARRPAAPDTARLDAALSVLNDPDAKDVSFGDPAARGRVIVSPGRGIVLIAAHLPKLDANRTFELWVIPAKGNPIPAGTFKSGADATALYVRPGPVYNAAAVAVTIEPEGGSPQPTTTPFIVTKL